MTWFGQVPILMTTIHVITILVMSTTSHISFPSTNSLWLLTLIVRRITCVSSVSWRQIGLGRDLYQRGEGRSQLAIA